LDCIYQFCSDQRFVELETDDELEDRVDEDRTDDVIELLDDRVELLDDREELELVDDLAELELLDDLTELEEERTEDEDEDEDELEIFDEDVGVAVELSLEEEEVIEERKVLGAAAADADDDFTAAEDTTWEAEDKVLEAAVEAEAAEDVAEHNVAELVVAAQLQPLTCGMSVPLGIATRLEPQLAALPIQTLLLARSKTA
jgi:hypothetical protein